MKYLYEHIKSQLSQYCSILDKYFDDNYMVTYAWSIENGNEGFSIDEIREQGRSIYFTHFANLELTKLGWEINEQFITIDEAFCKRWGEEYCRYIGTAQTAMYIFGYYKTLGRAIQNLAKYRTSKYGRKPQKVYV